MKKRHTEEQIIRILKEAESGIPVADVLREHNISQGTFYRWKAKFGGMDVSEAKRLKALEEENTRLKRLVAEQAPGHPDPEGCELKKVVTPAAKREMAGYVGQSYEVSRSHACGLLGLARSSMYYQPQERGRRTAARGAEGKGPRTQAMGATGV